jgi:hypothetical protein
MSGMAFPLPWLPECRCHSVMQSVCCPGCGMLPSHETGDGAHVSASGRYRVTHRGKKSVAPIVRCLTCQVLALSACAHLSRRDLDARATLTCVRRGWPAVAGIWVLGVALRVQDE